MENDERLLHYSPPQLGGMTTACGGMAEFARWTNSSIEFMQANHNQEKVCSICKVHAEDVQTWLNTLYNYNLREKRVCLSCESEFTPEKDERVCKICFEEFQKRARREVDAVIDLEECEENGTT